MELLVRTDLPAPWSFPFVGPGALVAVAGLLVLVTVWAYRRHPLASRRRVAALVALRLLALLLALVTAVRPSVGVLENPKVPSALVIGVDVSDSMNVPDEAGGVARIDAVRRALEKCGPTLDALKNEQNVEVSVYGFGASEFSPEADVFDPAKPAGVPRSDYAAFLRRAFERHQAGPVVRGVLVVGDGIDNGPTKPDADAARMRQTGWPVHTFAAGYATTDPSSKDVALVSLTPTTGTADGSVFVKTDFTLRLLVNAAGFSGTKANVRVQFDTGKGYEDVATVPTTLAKEADNTVDLKLKAPDRPGQIKVRAEIPVAELSGDVAPANNVIETYLTVTKEGMRVLLVNRASVEQAAIRRALDGPRVDLNPVIRQTEEPATPEEREAFDFDRRAYDVIVLGNVSAKQLTTLDPTLPARIRDQVVNKGVGLLIAGGHATLKGDPRFPDATGLGGVPEFDELLPVDLSAEGRVRDAALAGEGKRFQYLPVLGHENDYLNRIADTPAASNALWLRLNTPEPVPGGGTRSVRMTGVSPVGAVKGDATVHAVADTASAASGVPAPIPTAARLTPLLVSRQFGTGSGGRVLVFAGQDSNLWAAMGLPKNRDGQAAHARFWRQMVRWCAHQEEDEAQVFARPEVPRLPVRGKQTVRIGVRQPGGAPALKPSFPTVKILAPGQTEAQVQDRTPTPDPDAPGTFRVAFEPTVPGEHTVKVVGKGTDAKGAEIQGEAAARFLVYAVATDEALVKAARPDVLRRISSAGGGQARRLDDLPAFLDELRATPVEVQKPKPKFYPDWRRDAPTPFLPLWLGLFALVLAAEWGLRRYWGLV